MMNIMKKFFIIKTTDTELLDQPHEAEHHFEFKLSDSLKSNLALMNSFLCCCCPYVTKKQKKLHKIME